ncbi:PREDICTED: protein WVD2-like 4 isoform X2 [Tarenaya hassleriana]|uniref:protein WVD2-like 4 isoform X1 n=1 Tax=Tarenaya hassleriana TaxID=28532 RepID=UPI00053C489D|nr:PREDICTED: protein WVD2-like 4 isoform X1 [Tarenaya hassleriana]XP_010526024.1 PREDICTED: protein WVD2-like 4 isoform X2 [Tarenaya hassleriana]
MLSEVGIEVEDVEMNNVEQEPNKEEEANVGDGGKTPNENVEASEDVKRAENLELSAEKAENADANVPEAKFEKPVKEASNQESGTPKKSKLTMDKPVSKRQGTFSRSPRFFSQSLSFPSRGPHADITRKSIDASSKTNVKHVLSNGSKPKVSTKHASLGSTLHKKQTTPTKHGVKDAAPGLTSEVSKLVDTDSKPGKSDIPSKDDEGSGSATTLNSTPRGRRSTGSASGFLFRLEERAEKRKEFYVKLEEKIIAEEIEKSNLQAKSKENQEAEIKKLRTSLTFKAIPMPSFYKEPPPKVDLKKIPTTRPVSPKLGRKKGNKDATGGDSSPRPSRENVCSTKVTPKPNDSSVLKKPVTRSQPKLQTRESSAKTEKLVKRKPNKTLLSKQAKDEEEEEAKKAEEHQKLESEIPEEETAETTKEELNGSSIVPEAEDSSLRNSNEGEKPSSNVLISEIMPAEVVVGG